MLDKIYAGGISILFLLFVIVPPVQNTILEFLIYLTRPASTIILLSGVALLGINKLFLSFIVFSLFSIYILNHVWFAYIQTDARRQHLDEKHDAERFYSSALDIQVANGTVTPDAPKMLQKGSDVTLLLYPPTAEELSELCG